MARLKIDKEEMMPVDGPRPFDLEGWIATAPFEDLVGLVIDSAADGRAELRVPFRVKLSQGGGVMHGGALTTLADTSVAMAIKSLLPEGTIFATTELNTTFLAPVKSGWVRAVADVSRGEGRNFVGKADVFDEQEVLVARFNSNFRVARGQGFD